MIYPKKNLLVGWFFRPYISFILKLNFHCIWHNDLVVDKNKAVLFIANHCSWWDGFILYHINLRYFGKWFHIMILEETVQKVSFMKYMGAFSIQKNSRSAVASLDFAAGLLADPQNLVLVFPQGKLHSNFTDQIHFEKGLSRIIQKAAGDFQLIFAAMFTENFKHRKPTVSVYLKKQEATGGNLLNEAYQQFYQTAKAQQTDITF